MGLIYNQKDKVYCKGENCPHKRKCKRYDNTAKGVHIIGGYNVLTQRCNHFEPKQPDKVAQVIDKAVEKMERNTMEQNLDAIYMPYCMELVVLRYLDHLRAYMFVPGDADAKFLSREIDKAVRDFEKRLPIDPKKSMMIVKNVEKIDKICQKAMPRKFLFKENSPFTPFINGISAGIKQLPDGLVSFNNYEADTLAKAYFSYRLVHLATEAEGNAVEMLTGSLDGWKVPQYLANIGAACVMLIEFLGGIERKPSESRMTYVKRMMRCSHTIDILDDTTYDATVKMIEELEKIHIEQ